MSDKRPNIILIITDQQRFETINALGYPHMNTPNLDRLVNEGVSFDNCFITGATCVPSRASLFNGLYPHSSGVLRNGHCWENTWVEDLNDAGYRCVNVGKMHLFPFNGQAGFHERYIVENKDRFLEERYYFDEWDKALAAHGLVKQQRENYRLRDDYNTRLGAFEWDLPEHLHSDNFVGNMASWWLQSYPKTEPLFMEIGFPGPHPPFDPIERYVDEYMEKDFPLPDFTEEELALIPEILKQYRIHNTEVDHDSIAWSLDPTQEQLKRIWAYYLANVTMIDEQIGKIIQSLEDKGYLDNSIVLFVSDHGDCMGHHGQIQKWTMYDDIIRVPCIAWSPTLIKGGRRISEQVQLFDIGSTILELAGVSEPDYFESQSLVPALKGETFEGREYVFTEQGGDTTLVGCDIQTCVRSKEWKYVHFLGAEGDQGQLFDLIRDPQEKNNLWNDPEYQDKKAELHAVLGNFHIESAFRTRNYHKNNR